MPLVNEVCVDFLKISLSFVSAETLCICFISYIHILNVLFYPQAEAMVEADHFEKAAISARAADISAQWDELREISQARQDVSGKYLLFSGLLLFFFINYT